MKQSIVLFLLGLVYSALSMADNVVIKAPSYFKIPIRDNSLLFPDSLVFPRDAEEISIPDLGMIGRFENYGFTNLKKVTFGNIDYVPGGLFYGNPTIEEIEFNGLLGHFDCTLVGYCPNLRKITFHGPVSSTGGPLVASNCPQLDSVIFESSVVKLGVGVFTEAGCPKLESFTNDGAFLAVDEDSVIQSTSVEVIKKNPTLVKDYERLADWQSEVLTAKDPGWMRKYQYRAARVLLPVLDELGSSKAEVLKKAMAYAWSLGDEVKTELDILKESPKYAADTISKPVFAYAYPSDSLLRLSRERFNLDSVAGKGDDLSKIMNLLNWVHDNIQHDGSNGLPEGAKNLRNTYESARRDSCGYNCRALAICLAEALLAEGIPARYVTCESKQWDTDEDCHVICVAWSDSLNKWIWVDPTFAAVVSDENGLLLHPGEVRFRLQNDLPVFLNKEANWNNRYNTDKDYYIDEYMAKNLYILSANTINQAEPEGETDHPKGKIAALVPIGSNYTNANIISTDEDWFWSPPTVRE